MRLAYVDTSCLVAIAFAERQGPDIAAQLEAYDRLFSDNLLEAEMRTALAREDVGQDGDDLLSWLTWVFPAEPLTDEYRKILGHARLRGADLRHLACALYLERHVGTIDFLSLDERQREAAASLGLAMNQ